MLEFTNENHNYRARKLNTFDQMHVLKRVGPLILQIMQQVSGGQPEGVNAVLNQLETFLAALRQMADEDMDFVVKTCVGAVQRQQGTNGAGIWAPIFDPRSGMFMFEDINLLVVFDITSQVVRDNLGGFFPISSAGDGSPATQAALSG